MSLRTIASESVLKIARLAVTTLATVAAPVAVVSAQTSPIPIVGVTTPVFSSETFMGQPSVRHLPDGRLLVNDYGAKRLIVFDTTFSKFETSADSANASGTLYPNSPLRFPLIPYVGDSTLLADYVARAFLVIDPRGKVGRVMASPKPSDLTNTVTGSPSTDPRGRLIYRASIKPTPEQRPGDPPNTSTRDTIEIVRGDFDSRAVDTLATYTAPKFIGPQWYDVGGRYVPRMIIDPVPDAPDEWAVMTDGTVAVVRARDYHVDFFDVDGVKRSSPKLPYDWKRLTEEDKIARVDSMKLMIDSVNSAGGRKYGFSVRVMRSADGASRIDSGGSEISWKPLSQVADYVPPIRQGAVKADADNNLWILPTTTAQGGTGVLLDVVNRKGELFQRVRLPANTLPLGFGKGGVVYLARTTDKPGVWTIGRATVLQPARP